MRLRKNVKKTIYILLFMTIGLMIALNFSSIEKFVVENFVSKKEVFEGLDEYDTYSQTIDETMGTWGLRASVAPKTNLQAFRENSQFFYYPDSNSLSDNEFNVTYSISYDGNYSNGDFDSYGVYFEVPLLLFDNHRLGYDYSYSYNAEGNYISVLKSGTEVARTSFGDLVYENDASEDDEFVFGFYDDENGGDVRVYVYNNVVIDRNMAFEFNFDINYSFVPSVLQETTAEYSVYLTLSDELNGEFADVYLNLLYDVDYEGGVEDDDLGSFEKSSETYESWQSEWGSNFLGSGYYYNKYAISGTAILNGSNSINLSYDFDDGIIVSYYNGVSYSSSDLNFYTITSATAGAVNVVRTVIVAYPLPTEGSTSSVTFSANLSRDSLTKDFTWNLDYYRAPSGPVIRYPEGTNISINENLVSNFAGKGAVNKLKNNTNAASTWLIESAANIMNQTGSGVVSAFNLYNTLNDSNTSYTVTLETDGFNLDSTAVASSDNLVLSDSDYVISSFYPQDDIEYDYVLNGTSYILNKNTNYATYGNKQVYVYISGSWQLIGSYKKDTSGNINYVSNGSLTSNISNVSSTNPIILPSDVTNIKVVYTGNRAAIYMGININAELKPTSNVLNKVNSLIADEKSVVLRSKSKAYDGTDLTSSNYANNYLTELASRSNIDMTSNVENRTSSGNVVTYTTTVYEQIDFDDSNRDVALEVIKKQNDVTFYALLPKGATFKSASVLKYNTATNATIRTLTKDNHGGSGRTLLTIVVTGDNDNVVTYGNYARSGYTLNLTINYSLSANQTYGTTLLSDVIYRSADLSDAYSPISAIPDSAFSSAASKTALSSINANGKVLAASSVDEVEEVSISVGTYRTKVKVENGTYTDSVKVKESKKYSYQLQYVPVSEYEQIQNLVFFDKIDSSPSNVSGFKGIFDSVDTSYLNTEGVTTTVYYSTVTDIDLTNADYLNLSNTTVWNTYMPSDKSKITAVAISCGDHTFEYSDGISPMVEVNLVAPNNYVSGQTKKAYNNSYLKYNVIGGSTSTISSNTTAVELEKATITVKHYYGTSSSDTSTSTGSESSPIVVSGNYGYKIEVSNTGTETYENLVVDDVLPNGVNVNGTITYSSGVTVDTSSGIKINIASLGANEKKTIWIPVTIDMTEVSGGNSTFVNTVSFNSLNGMNYNGEELKVYTKAMVATLSFAKYGKTADSGSYIKDEVLIITKGETYSYKIHVKNNSSVEAKSITIEDTVDNGLLNVTNISNGGTYDSVNRKVVWTFDLNANSEVNLTYNVTVPSDASVGTRYSASAHISMVHPYKAGDTLYNENMNNITVLYQIVSDIKVTNKVAGNLANNLKLFTYSFEFTAPLEAVGEYHVYKNGTSYGTFIINGEGKGSYTTTLKADDVLVIKQLPGNVNYSVKLNKESGYTISSNITGSSNPDSYVLTGVTNDDSGVNYVLTNTYDARTTATVRSKVTYGGTLTNNLFKFKLTDSTGNTQVKGNNSDGSIVFDEIAFNNVVGTFRYTIEQENNHLAQTEYDTKTYFAVITVTDDGNGNLSAVVKYFDQQDKEISEVIYNNTYLPTGLTINCVNNSVYVDSTKEFIYDIAVTGSVAGQYSIIGDNNNEIGKLVVDASGNGSYNFKLKSNKLVLISDLPIGTSYTITQDAIDYYESTVSVSSLRGEKVVYSGVIEDDSIQVSFYNTYRTRGSFEPKLKVELLNNEMEGGEFAFKIKDVSTGSTNGYTETVGNDELGNINFTTINYDRPGVYKYEITQVKGSSNKVKYDLTKCLLTVTLTDNGDGTMRTDYSMTYQNGSDKFVNEYSETPVQPPNNDDNNVPNNPNTFDNIMVVLCALLFVILIALFNKIRLSKKVMK